VISTLVGVCLGTFLGAMIGELSGGREAAHAATVGVGAAKGRLMGTLAKVAIGGIMFLIALWVGFPHHFAVQKIPASTMPTTLRVAWNQL
jgi:uncharacterized protein YqgC (DUF456 family)